MELGLRFLVLPPNGPEETFAAAVARGLSAAQKFLPSRFLYDARGSRLFEAITRLPEYYLTRCETEILERQGHEILATVGDDMQVVEFGSGSSEKTRMLLRAVIERQGLLEYVPIDISTEFLRNASLDLLDDVPNLRVTAVAADFLQALKSLPHHDGPRMFLFLGSTIGNFAPHEAVEFMRSVARCMRPQDRFLVGVDLHKPSEIIEPAYNDSEGVTAEFNRNLLTRINRELCGHFDSRRFEHAAPWIEDQSRVEMRLISIQDQEIQVEGLDRTFDFQAGEYIHTENSHKWSPEVFSQLVRQAGLSTCRSWQDQRGWFSLELLEPDCQS